MKAVGVICEYNPLHNGHVRQLRHIRGQYPEAAIVCLMSGNFVQRGAPAQFHRTLRARAAVLCGADLVLELPVNYALSSAEGFAAGGVRILSGFCDGLCFGAETADASGLTETARLLLSEEFSGLLRRELEQGISFPAARQNALRSLGGTDELLARPNDILAVEYCKAIRQQSSPLKPIVIRREGDYHSSEPDPHAPSATALRELAARGESIAPYIPEAAAKIFSSAALHSLEAGERAVLARLRTMTEEEFEALPYGSEGLWRKLMHESRQQPDLQSILNAVKSKRYTRSRLDRMVMCAFLGITAQTLAAPPDYTRVLAFNDRGRQVLRQARETASFYNVGQAVDHPHWALEQRCADLYGLFAEKAPQAPQGALADRVFYFS